MSLHRFDHAAAKAYFVSLDPGERSSQAVAEKFSVSRRTVDKWRKLDGWNEAAAAEDRRVSAALERQATKSREQRALQNARLRDLAASRLEKRLQQDDITDDFVARVFADLAKQVRLDEGDATDHVTVAQVQAGFRETIEAAYRLAGAIGGVELQRQFRERLPGLVQERLALIGGDDA